jgi:NDP-hexose C3-ketoreductase / dTDP-4-oxo-2-deoxy-alpha-D-pentos-2-ene 2,3-reductase
VKGSPPGLTDNRASLEQYEALADQVDVTPTAFALAWLLSRPGVTAPVLGPRTLDQLTGSLPALDIAIEDGTSNRLDELFPGPGGEAPDAYTWS